jgi:hypothetical protein
VRYKKSRDKLAAFEVRQSNIFLVFPACLSGASAGFAEKAPEGKPSRSAPATLIRGPERPVTMYLLPKGE